MSAPITTTAVSVDEYLALTDKPYFEYVDGTLIQKPMPTADHALVEGWLPELIRRRSPGFIAASELSVQLREGKFLIPDVAVMRADQLQRPYPTRPVHLCIEIKSPEDRIGELLMKCEEYHQWGVPHCWVLDSGRRVAWQYDRGTEPLRVTSGPLTAAEISLDLAEIFSVLDQH